MKIENLLLLFYLFFIPQNIQAQVCGTPGKDGARINRLRVINTYFSPVDDLVLPIGSRQLMLDTKYAGGAYSTRYGDVPITIGDLLIIIQMQDALIHFSNDLKYGANDPFSGPDGLGGTGYVDLRNSGKYEYVVATNAVPLLGGLLTFKGAGPAMGTVNEYTSATATDTRSSRSFQVIRVPQYSSLTLDEDLLNVSFIDSYVPRFHHRVGGVLAFHVAGTLNLNGHTVDGSGQGFIGGGNGRGFYSDDNYTRNDVYAQISNSSNLMGKGDGVGGSPSLGFPLGTRGRGAPGNAGGSGYLSLAGGGGGGNGGAGGVGGNGSSYGNLEDAFPNGGRPGSAVYGIGSSPDRLMSGGGGGGGDVNSVYYSDYRSGGAIVLINANRITGTGRIISNGKYQVHDLGENPDLFPGGGGGAGGTIFINELHGDLSANVTIEAKGGYGGSPNLNQTINASPGPGGGGGGGQVFSSISSPRAIIDVSKGKAGRLYPITDTKFAADGQDGNVKHFTNNDLPPYLRYSNCLPELNTSISQSHLTASYHAGEDVIYFIKISNMQSATASGVKLEVKLPMGFSFVSAKASYTGDASGPADLTNSTVNANLPLMGDFVLFSGDEVLVTLIAKIDCSVLAGTYHASAQTLSPDPLRTAVNPDRMVTPAINAFPNTFTSYETSGDLVPGINYNGNLPGSNLEDVVVIGSAIIGNQIQQAQTTVFCLQGDPDVIQGSTLSGGIASYSYQWQQSTDGQGFTNITGATGERFDPPLLTESLYYRRNVFMQGCTNNVNSSNVVFMNVVKPLPVPDFLMPDVCLKDGIAHFKNATALNDGALDRLSYAWDFGDDQASFSNPNTSTEMDASHLYTKIGNYTVSLTVLRDGACPQTIQKQFRVNGNIPKADFIIQGTAKCSGQELVFEDRATVDFGEISRIEWYFDDQDPGQVQIDLQPEKRNAVSRIYKHQYPAFHSPLTKSVTVRMVVYSGSSCIDERRMALVLQASPELTFDPIASVCRNAPAFQLSQAKEIWGMAGNGKYFGLGVNAQGKFNPELAGVGTHRIRYVFTADNGCTVEKSQQVTVLPIPVADAGGDLSVLEGGTVQLAMDTKGATGNGSTNPESTLSYKWSPSRFLDRDNVRNPFCSPSSDQTYTLTVTNTEDCTSTDQVNVRVIKDPEVPNTFTPNGDGINDEWKIKYLDSYPKASINIFNRYGTKVFIGDSKSKFWDGKYNGEDLPVGTYYYVIDPHNGRKILSGSITILR